MADSSRTTHTSWEYILGKTKKERMASYIRESDISLAESTTIDSQAKACREYGERQGYAFNIMEHEYREAISGYYVSYTERTILLKMLEAAKRHEFDVLVVSEIRALGRKQVEIFVIYDQLQKYGIRLETISEKFEDSAMGRLILSLRAAFSEIEHDQILLRLERGRKDRVEISKAINGHSQPGYGHVFIDTARETKGAYALDTSVVHVDETGSKWTPVSVIRYMRDLLLQGMSVRSIAMQLTQLGIPNPKVGRMQNGKPIDALWQWSTVYRLLTDTRIMGVVYANKYHQVNGKQVVNPREQQILLPVGTAPPLITEEEFTAIQQQLQRNKEESSRNNGHPYEEQGLFRAGYCICGICKYRMTVRYHSPERKKKNPYPQYICRKKTGHTDILHFHTTTISQPVLDASGWKYAVTVICNPSLVRDRVALFRQQNTVVIDRDSVERAIEALQKQILNLFSLAKTATDDDSIARLGQMLNDLEQQKQKAQAMLYDIEEEQEQQEKIEAEIVRFEQWANEVRPHLGNPDYTPSMEEKRLAIRIIGLRCTVYPVKGDWPFRRQFELAPPEIMKLLLKHCVANGETIA